MVALGFLVCGNILYSFLYAFQGSTVRLGFYLMVLSRFIAGMGAGKLQYVLQNYINVPSSNKIKIIIFYFLLIIYNIINCMFENVQQFTDAIPSKIILFSRDMR